MYPDVTIGMDDGFDEEQLEKEVSSFSDKTKSTPTLSRSSSVKSMTPGF
jgi:hypothetical protein